MHYQSIALIFVLTFCRLRGQEQCPPCDCSSLSSCIGDRSEDPCDCCNGCSDIGEDCGEGIGECIGNLLCLPDDPYSSDYGGKCYELSDCLSFGCTDEGGDCKCLYSSSCPLKRFPYYTIEECKESLLRKRCESIECPPQPTAQDCKDGMYFEQGPSYYDECCPLSGRCVCNVSLCSRPPECGTNSKLIVVKESNEDLGQCCAEYECQRAHVCIHKNEEYNLNEMWKETPCKTCLCTLDGASCTYTNCSQLEDCEITYIPEGECCPVCFQSAVVDIPPGAPPEPMINICVGEDGSTYEEGEEFMSGHCRMCRCKNGRMVCEEKMCGPLVCDEYEVQGWGEDECCPKCMNKTQEPTMEHDKDILFNPTMQGPTQTSSHPPTQDSEDTESTTEETTASPPSDRPLPSNIELVMVLDAPYADVSRKWDEFSMELASILKSYELQAASMSYRESMGSAVLVVSVESVNSESSEEQTPTHLTEDELAVMVSQTAQDFEFISTQNDMNHSKSLLGIDEAEYNATIVVLTLIAAIALVSFIGVFIGVILITRRLKTIKAIRGQNHKRSARP